MRKDVEQLIEVYSTALSANGPTPHGLLWPNAPDLATRFETLLHPIDMRQYGPDNRVRLLDVGCGPGLLLDYLSLNGLLPSVDYVGVDVFDATLGAARSRWPGHRFELRDVRDAPFEAGAFDYCIICGVFTGRFTVSFADMEAMAQGTLSAIWPSVTIGLAFNVMSKHVDWERDDLFHWPLDSVMAFSKAHLSRHVTLRLDYGLPEASVYVLRDPVERKSQVPNAWTIG
jgi:SAM-dependent methyltransferase